MLSFDMRPRLRPERYAAQAERNRAYFRAAVSQGLELNAAMPAATLQDVETRLRATLHPLRVTAPPGFWPCNPSIVSHQGRLLCTIRCVNYQLPHGAHGPTPLRSVNLIARLCDDLSIESVREIRDLDPSPRVQAFHSGYEDIRLFSLHNALGASASVLDRHENRTEMALLELTNDFDIARAVVQETSNPRAEKNWMPVVTPDGLRWICHTSPTTVVRAPGLPNPIATYAMTKPLGELRGSSQLLSDGFGGYLAVVHETHQPYRPFYKHRFIAFDASLKVTGVSGPFHFVRAGGVEFCAGMTRHRGRLILSFGVNDNEAWLAEVNENEVLANIATDRPAARVARATSTALSRRVLVCHSDQERCGVREYGVGLDRAIGGVTATSFRALHQTAHHDALLVHYEPGLLPPNFLHTLTNIRQRGTKVVFVCHWFGPRVLREYGPALVDRFVLHRDYEGTDLRCVKIPLACPVFHPLRRSEKRIQLGIPADKLVVGVFGFLVPSKRVPESIDALLETNREVIALAHTPHPFEPTAARIEEQKMREVCKRYPGRVIFSTEFLREEETLARVAACDFGMAFHAMHTGSVSATSKQYTAARCPVAVSASNHMSDVENGVVRVETLDPRVFGQEVGRAISDKNLLAMLRQGAEREYARVNMGVVAGMYRDLIASL